MKVVINKCYGGFGLSHKAILRYCELREIPIYWEEDKEDKNIIYYGVEPNFMSLSPQEQSEVWFSDRDIPRDNSFLVSVVEELGIEANGRFAELKVVEIPDDVKGWEIEEYDGFEWVSEQHRRW